MMFVARNALYKSRKFKILTEISRNLKMQVINNKQCIAQKKDIPQDISHLCCRSSTHCFYKSLNCNSCSYLSQSNTISVILKLSASEHVKIISMQFCKRLTEKMVGTKKDIWQDMPETAHTFEKVWWKGDYRVPICCFMPYYEDF